MADSGVPAATKFDGVLDVVRSPEATWLEEPP
ncbi:MAG: hypothetical protein JWO91_1089 [Acidobacteriaceae bacterium]|nr:hypothetical protein [Acidobacteriaceae bacterium]